MLKPGKIGLAVVVGLMLSLFLLTTGAFAQRAGHSSKDQPTSIANAIDTRLKANIDFQHATNIQISYQQLNLQCECEGICLQHQDCAYGNCAQQQRCWFGDCSRYRHCDDWWCSRW